MKTIAEYPPALAELVVPGSLPPIGPGSPNSEAYAKLKELHIETAFEPHEVRDRDMAGCCLAGLWLLHGYLDESHRLSQEIETTTGSYWHGLMHRREPDYGNAKYWFRRVGTHPVFATLQPEAAQLAATAEVKEARFLTRQGAWDPFAFIDLCEQAAQEPAALDQLCRQVQQREWELLFEHCYRGVSGT